MQNYQTIPILSVLIILYFASLLLVKTKKISLFQQQRIWNIVLLITFLVAGSLGLIMAISLDQKINFTWYLPILELHVKFGVAMAVISIFHTIWHLPYFSSILKNFSNKKTD